uniref:Uncharacterized protein n=1 Tax=Anopheles dirus TaxID=7168 RepID=A0A182NTG4_9DIPT
MSGPQCRLCLAKVGDSDCSVLEDMFRRAIERVFTFVISPTEGLPTSVCRECATYVWDFSVYSEKVEHNQQFLLTWCPAENVKTESTQEENVPNHDLAKTLDSTKPIQDSDDDVDAMYDYAVNPEEVTDTHDEVELEYEQQLDGGMDCEERGATLSEDSDVEEVVRETVVIALDNGESSGEERDTQEPVQERRSYGTRSGQLPRKVKPSGAYSCGTCDESFKLKRDLKYHTQKKHAVRRVAKVTAHSCVQCDKSFRTKMQLRDHQRSHKREQCPKCGKMIVQRYIKSHIAAHDGAFRCDVCDRCFSSAQFLKQHRLQAHLPAGATKTEQCDQCGQAFYTKYQLATHQRTHEKVVCKICKKQVIRQRFKGHLAGHRGEFRCNICVKTFASNLWLRQHMDLQHASKELPVDDRFACDQCDERFHNGAQRRQHRYNKHAMRQCPICKEMVKAIAFPTHRAIHQRPGRVWCDVCGRTYASKTSLKKHVLLLHSGIEPTVSAPTFPRHHCEKTFPNRGKLMTHLYWTKKQECPVPGGPPAEGCTALYECAFADSFSSRAHSSCCRKCCWLAVLAPVLAAAAAAAHPVSWWWLPKLAQLLSGADDCSCMIGAGNLVHTPCQRDLPQAWLCKGHNGRADYSSIVSTASDEWKSKTAPSDGLPTRSDSDDDILRLVRLQTITRKERH